ncbi:hypothetical protein [Sulfobacillus thermosulfidooxidans]|uniref:Uncharacterized protein n=1 Tax=Sulfobacillus thermosulfidooxidans (strain DSM 9293 / VKM B-1269 / AT-1) TaxID=929705 RepID=A0A1W1WI67_SULTA|nr:hypothetical protein [Sulfobacillus thermosulfidooxidans]SMC06011.1 hypothetical protein SAMN00768000_2587 [Sulfobacillus thermosulfidooxidans DSM 9293]
MRTTKVPVLTVEQQPQPMGSKPVINERLQALGRKIVQEHLEAFKRLADK